MNFKKLMLLAVALAVGNAGAATLAGTSIINQANATFTVGGASQTTNSTVATTTVNPIPSYTITPGPAGGTEAAPALSSTVATGAPVNYNNYIITNTGNTFIQVNIGATYGTGSSAITTVNLNGTAVTTVAAGSTPTSTTTTATIAPGATLNLAETFTAPATAGNYFTNPVGVSINYTKSAVDAGNTQLATAPTTMDVTGQALADTDNVNKTTVTTNTPVLGGPDTNPNDGSVITPPTTPVTVPTPGTGGPTNTNPSTPGNSTGPGYTSPTGPGGSTPVVVDGNNQYAFPKADTNTTDDTVTMTGTVGNPNPVDTSYVLNPGPNYTYNPTTGVFTGNPGTPAEGTTVTFTDASGTPLTGGTTGPSLTVPANSTANYNTVVTYPDSESTDAKTTPITVPVTVNGAGPENFVVMPPNVTFGNSNGSTAGVDPAARDVTLVTPSVITCVVYPMDVANTGTYAEAYNLTASTTTGGSIKYVASLPTATTTAGVMSAADCATVTAATALPATGTIQPGAEQTVYAIVTVPSATPAGTYTINQQVTGTYSGTVKQFNTDTVTVGAVSGSGLTVTKTVNPTTANPGASLTYTITATNNYNTSIYGLIVADPSTGAGTASNSVAYTASNLFGTSGFVTPNTLTATASGSGVTGTVLYRINGGAWSSAAPTVDASTTKVEVAVDNNLASNGTPDGTIDSNDVFPAGAVLTITLTGTVK